jgi:hypothetical protein
VSPWPRRTIEGEAVERELALAAWPEPGYAGPLAADGLAVTADGGRGVGDVEHGLALDVEVRQHPVEPPRHPPRLLAEKSHDGGHERHGLGAGRHRRRRHHVRRLRGLRP